MRREFWFVRNLVQVNLTPAHIVISVGKPRGKVQREETKTATPSTVNFAQGRRTEEPRRFHDCVGGEEGGGQPTSVVALSVATDIQTWAETFCGLACHCRLAAHQNSPRPYQPSIRRTLELHNTVSSESGGQVPETKARFCGDSR